MTHQRQSTFRTDTDFRDPDGIPEEYTWPAMDMVEPDHVELGDRASVALGWHDLQRIR